MSQLDVKLAALGIEKCGIPIQAQYELTNSAEADNKLGHGLAIHIVALRTLGADDQLYFEVAEVIKALRKRGFAIALHDECEYESSEPPNEVYLDYEGPYFDACCLGYKLLQVGEEVVKLASEAEPKPGFEVAVKAINDRVPFRGKPCFLIRCHDISLEDQIVDECFPSERRFIINLEHEQHAGAGLLAVMAYRLGIEDSNVIRVIEWARNMVLDDLISKAAEKVDLPAPPPGFFETDAGFDAVKAVLGETKLKFSDDEVREFITQHCLNQSAQSDQE